MNYLASVLFIVAFIACYSESQYVSVSLDIDCQGVAGLIGSQPSPINFTTISGQSTEGGSHSSFEFVGQPTLLTFVVSCYEFFYCYGDRTELLVPAEIQLNLSYNNNAGQITISGAVKTYNYNLTFTVINPSLSVATCGNGDPCVINTKSGNVQLSVVNNPKVSSETVFNVAGTTPIVFNYTGNEEYFSVTNAPVYYGLNSLMTTFNPNYVWYTYIPVPGLVYYFNIMAISDNGSIGFTCSGDNGEKVTVMTTYYHTFILTPGFYQWNVDTTAVTFRSGYTPYVETISSTTVSCNYGNYCTYKTPQGNAVSVNILSTP